jgi:hypothetical protein
MLLILVHIGKTFPEYINTCISQIRAVSNIEIHILISNEHNNKIIVKDNVNIIELESIPKSDKHIIFSKISRLDTSFRSGFWKYATMRFIYIYDYMFANNLTDVFHIEYDNLIYLDFTKQIDVFRTLPFWCVMDAPTRCIPSFIYMRDISICERLIDKVIDSASKNINDMYALAQFRNDNKKVY